MEERNDCPTLCLFFSTTNLSFAFYSIQVLAHWPYYLVIFFLDDLACTALPFYFSATCYRQVCREILEKPQLSFARRLLGAMNRGAPLRSNEPLFIALGPPTGGPFKQKLFIARSRRIVVHILLLCYTCPYIIMSRCWSPTFIALYKGFFNVGDRTVLRAVCPFFFRLIALPTHVSTTYASYPPKFLSSPAGYVASNF
jgi:hypothetical protein